MIQKSLWICCGSMPAPVLHTENRSSPTLSRVVLRSISRRRASTPMPLMLFLKILEVCLAPRDAQIYLSASASIVPILRASCRLFPNHCVGDAAGGS